MKQFVDIFSESKLSSETDFGNMDIEFELDQGSSSSSSSSSIQQLGSISSSPAIDRYNPIIRDPRRIAVTTTNNLSSSSPPLLISNQQKQTTTTTTFASKIINNKLNKKKKQPNTSIINGSRSWSCMKSGGGFISPPGSSRFLLSDNNNNKSFFNLYSSDFNPPPPLPPPPIMKMIVPPPPETSKIHAVTNYHESTHDASMPSATPPRPTTEQVVVLRVSLHCRGCERKMRKHLSRMEGVSSYNIDFAAKKVTVVGNVTPLEVLANILKVKNAQLWTPPIH